uniref:Polypyrimidine tract binding protein 2 n=1 Tax=Homo sapiens TaxID=9606 RepID=A0A6Q8PFT8_HUMAN
MDGIVTEVAVGVKPMVMIVKNLKEKIKWMVLLLVYFIFENYLGK